jgi:hypothetical protein
MLVGRYEGGQGSRMATELIQLTNQPKPIEGVTVMSLIPKAKSGTSETRAVVPRPTPQNTVRAAIASKTCIGSEDNLTKPPLPSKPSSMYRVVRSTTSIPSSNISLSPSDCSTGSCCSSSLKVSPPRLSIWIS